MQPAPDAEPRTSLLSRIAGAFSMLTGAPPPAPPVAPPPAPPNLLDVLFDVVNQRLVALRPNGDAAAAPAPNAPPSLSWTAAEDALRSAHALLPAPLQSVDGRYLLGGLVVAMALLGTVLLNPVLFVLRILAFAYVSYASFFALAHSQLAQQDGTRKLGLALYAVLLVYLVKTLL